MTTDESSVIAVQVGNVDQKLDAIHLSLKEDVEEIKHQTQRTNGRVTNLEKGQAAIKGGLAVLSLLMPAIVFVLQRVTAH